MDYIYIDESGSMTVKHCHIKGNRYFCLALLHVKESKKKALKTAFKRFISRHMNELRQMDMQNKMFDKDGNFQELKGSCLTPPMKEELTRYLCQNQYFDVFFLRVDHTEIDENFYQYPARAFNYLLGLMLKFFLNGSHLGNGEYTIQIDERNTKTGARYSLEEYLYINLVLQENLVRQIKVEYFDSIDNKLIQIADFFSNLCLSFCYNKDGYESLFNVMKETGYFHEAFIFPHNT